MPTIQPSSPACRLSLTRPRPRQKPIHLPTCICQRASASISAKSLLLSLLGDSEPINSIGASRCHLAVAHTITRASPHARPSRTRAPVNLADNAPEQPVLIIQHQYSLGLYYITCVVGTSSTLAVPVLVWTSSASMSLVLAPHSTTTSPSIQLACWASRVIRHAATQISCICPGLVKRRRAQLHCACGRGTGKRCIQHAVAASASTHTVGRHALVTFSSARACFFRQICSDTSTKQRLHLDYAPAAAM